MPQHYVPIDPDDSDYVTIVESRRAMMYARVSATTMLVYDICKQLEFYLFIVFE